MTKTNRFTLIATVLLSILLYTIIQFAHDLNVAWDGAPLEPPAVTRAPTAATAEPRITSATALQTVINDSNLEADLKDYAAWSDARGFNGDNRLFGTPPAKAPSARPATSDEAELRIRSEAGDAEATQTLAAQALFTDPFAAIALFRQAAEQGSTYALLRIGSLHTAIDTAGTRNVTSDPAQLRRIADLAEQGVNHSLQLTAFGYLITALRDGGLPIVDYDLLEWLDQLNEAATDDERVAVCKWSERALIDIAKSRVRWGKPAVTTAAPPIFFAIPGLADRLPCRRTAYSVDNLMDLSHCTITKVRNARDQALDLYKCNK